MHICPADPKHAHSTLKGGGGSKTPCGEAPPPAALLMSLATRRKTPSKCRLQLRRDGTICTPSLKINEFHATNTISDNTFVDFCKRSDVHDEANLTSDRPTTLPKSLRYDLGRPGNGLCDDFGRHAGAKCADLNYRNDLWSIWKRSDAI